MVYACDPPGLGPLPEHAALYAQEVPRMGYRFFSTMCWSGLGAYEHIVIIGDLRSDMGRRLAKNTAPDWPITERLAEANQLGLIPACCHVEPLDEIIAAADILGDHLVQRIHARPAGTTPILVIDRTDEVALTWAVLDPWEGGS